MNRSLLGFDKEQRILEIGGIKVGGQLGEQPTVLIGSIFHRGHKVLEDPKKGTFDRRQAERLIRRQEALSERTGNPCMLDVVGETSEALIRCIDFVSGVTEAPFLINGPNKAVRVDAARHVVEAGLMNRAVYTSLNYTATPEECAAIKELGMRAAVIKAFNPRNPWIKGMLQLLMGTKGEGGLLQAASQAGIDKPLILAPVLDIPSIGLAAGAIHAFKDEFGFPAGAAPIGVVGSWRGVGEFGNASKRLGRAAAATLIQSMGANFVIYGSVGRAPDMFPACALADAMIAYGVQAGEKRLLAEHPLYKIL